MTHRPLAVARPAVALGMTFLAIGITFGLPVRLVPEATQRLLGPHISPEVANVYACAAWAGWAHFIFAFRGQMGAIRRMAGAESVRRLTTYVVLVGITLGGLLAMRLSLGLALFGAIAWTYFIDHFLKAELSFDGVPRSEQSWRRFIRFYQPLVSFIWLSVVLLNGSFITQYPWVIWLVSLVLGLTILFHGGLRELGVGDARIPLLALFFVFEALIWGTFYPYGGPRFNYGVYIFHIAAGSYYHYFGSYYAALARSQGRDRWLTAPFVVAVNVMVLGAGLIASNMDPFSWLRPIFGVDWFTLWVALHLVASDLFPSIKAWRGAHVTSRQASRP